MKNEFVKEYLDSLNLDELVDFIGKGKLVHLLRIKFKKDLYEYLKSKNLEFLLDKEFIEINEVHYREYSGIDVVCGKFNIEVYPEHLEKENLYEYLVDDMFDKNTFLKIEIHDCKKNIKNIEYILLNNNQCIYNSIVSIIEDIYINNESIDIYEQSDEFGDIMTFKIFKLNKDGNGEYLFSHKISIDK